MSDLTERLAEALAVCDAATEGPWEWERGPLGQPRELPGVLGVRVLTYPDEPDAEFIAHARTGYPAALRALQAVMEMEDEPIEGIMRGYEIDEAEGANRMLREVHRVIQETMGDE